MPETKNEIMIVDEQSLRNKIYTIRGQQVMMDFDLAEIYGYTVSAFNQQVKRNEDRFPEDFMFKLHPEELPKSLKSQNVILNVSGNKRGLHIKKMPNAAQQSAIDIEIDLLPCMNLLLLLSYQRQNNFDSFSAGISSQKLEILTVVPSSFCRIFTSTGL